MTATNRISRFAITIGLISAAIAPLTQAGDFVGLEASTNKLYDMSPSNPVAMLMGTITGAPQFGFGAIDRGLNGILYATAPGAVSGYSIYRIDETLMSATQIISVSTTNSGGVGLAIDPSGTKAWVAGFVGFSLIAKLQEVDLATGVVTNHGSFSGNSWGLAFDQAGNLYSTMQGQNAPVLIKVDQVNAANSIQIGFGMPNVDMTQGLVLASDRGSGMPHVFSRATDTLYGIDIVTGLATNGVPFTNALNISGVAEDDACFGVAVNYGVGCAGSGGFIPSVDITGCPVVNGTITYSITKGLGGSSAILFFGLAPGIAPVGGGCFFMVGALTQVSFSVPLGGVGPGAGSVSFPATIPAGLEGLLITTQAWVLDPAVMIGAAGSNGVQISIAP